MSITGLKYRLEARDLEALFERLSSEGCQNIGPVARDSAIMLETLDEFDDLARGYTEEQGKGHYSLHDRKDGSFFHYTLGPQSFKKFLHPPRRKLWAAQGSKQSFSISGPAAPPKMAFWGIRSCDLAAIGILDKIFLKEAFVNEWYKKAREQLFIIAVGCTHPSRNCFCTTMGTGPKPVKDFDLSLVEVKNEKDHFFIAEINSERAVKLAIDLEFKHAKDRDVELAKMAIESAVKQMTVKFKPEEAAKLLKRNLEHKHWDEVAGRCLSCANCTMVCPTCFCSTTEDITDLTGDHSERWLVWDSCFNGDFSYIRGGKIFSSTKSRYRQWMTHKLSNWYDQFDTSGCVGCGRCITWCPVGIDITEELMTIQHTEKIDNVIE